MQECPALGAGWVLLYGLLLTIVLTFMNYFIVSFNWTNIIGFFPAGVFTSLLVWQSESLWFTTISKMIVNPYSLVSYASRIPFWFIASGMGYTLGFLLAKKHGLFVVYEVPAKQLFQFGGKVGCALQIPAQFISHQMMKRTASKVASD